MAAAGGDGGGDDSGGGDGGGGGVTAGVRCCSFVVGVVVVFSRCFVPLCFLIGLKTFCVVVFSFNLARFPTSHPQAMHCPTLS